MSKEKLYQNSICNSTWKISGLQENISAHPCDSRLAVFSSSPDPGVEPCASSPLRNCTQIVYWIYPPSHPDMFFPWNDFTGTKFPLLINLITLLTTLPTQPDFFSLSSPRYLQTPLLISPWKVLLKTIFLNLSRCTLSCTWKYKKSEDCNILRMFIERMQNWKNEWIPRRSGELDSSASLASSHSGCIRWDYAEVFEPQFPYL